MGTGRGLARALMLVLGGAAGTMGLSQTLANEAAPSALSLGSAGLIILAAAPAAPAAAAPGNAAAGMDVFMRQCRVCHTVAKDGPNRRGPNLFGVVGRQAGTVANYAYSDAFKKAATWKWETPLLGGWVTNPGALVVGTAMANFPGVADKDRNDVLAYLASLK